MTYSVRYSAELERIIQLPRRRIDAPEWADIHERMTPLLRRPGGTQTLRPMQALALHDIGVQRGGFIPAGVGEGKTLPSLLAAYVLDAKRPMLLQPASLIDKTTRDLDKYAQHWLIPSNIYIVSYQSLGLVQYESLLDDYAPDLIIGDEAHYLKNRRAAVTKRVGRRLHAHPDTMCVWFSGSFLSKSLNEIGHLLRWALKGRAPVPRTVEELDNWSNALEERKEERDYERHIEPGALLRLASAEDEAPDDVTTARRAFRRRLNETAGVVSTIGSGEEVGASIEVRAIRYKVSREVDEHINDLRTGKRLPDEWEVEQGVDVWRHARELALGFYNVWNPRPPDDWRNARRDWFAFVRDVLGRYRTLDSPEHVAKACDDGRLPNEALERWRAVRGKFTPQPEPVWLDSTALDIAAKWAAKPGIVWVEHTAFGRALAERTGLPYYREGGFDATKRFIEDADPTRACIASIDANREGKNLQELFSRNLFTSLGNALETEQAIGRTHRPGTTADVVTVDIMCGCIEHVRAFDAVLSGSAVIRDTIGGDAKMLRATIVDWPSPQEVAAFSGAAWGKTT